MSNCHILEQLINPFGKNIILCKFNFMVDKTNPTTLQSNLLINSHLSSLLLTCHKWSKNRLSLQV